LSEYSAICFILWHIEPWSLAVFVFSSLIAAWYCILFFISLVHWWGETANSEQSNPALDNMPPTQKISAELS
jgi:hypothetical protein